MELDEPLPLPARPRKEAFFAALKAQIESHLGEPVMVTQGGGHSLEPPYRYGAIFTVERLLLKWHEARRRAEAAARHAGSNS
jgi:hypothetical protein